MCKPKWLGVASIVAALVSVGTGSVHAQQGSVFGANSPLGGSSGFGTGTAGSSGNAVGGGLNSTAFSKAPTVANGQQQQQGLGNSNLSILQNGTGRANGMVGAGNAQQQNGFLGAQAGQQGALGRGQTGQRQGLNQGNTRRGANRGNANNQFQQQNFANQGNMQGQTNQRQIRPQMQVAFNFKRPPQQKTDQVLTRRFDNLNLRFQKLSERPAFKGLKLETDNGVVTLRGEVETEADSKLATNLVLLEPGVKSVENELTVTSAAEPPAPGN